eukprot:CAMPEP_0197269054 /NCGR_PEP_ID=MMETSP1432-20130617/4535_1 /TAXON_ID=44447 /ORGANISM="Pseudo-nitzschia delicatissima, Strain UNC1205" /LENGTH=183 /DNA_ID=CAMNT_0042734155 /DNA_START=29 /DNA_END=577 /DNA_ORIENTATION=+
MANRDSKSTRSVTFQRNNKSSSPSKSLERMVAVPCHGRDLDSAARTPPSTKSSLYSFEERSLCTPGAQTSQDAVALVRAASARVEQPHAPHARGGFPKSPSKDASCGKSIGNCSMGLDLVLSTSLCVRRGMIKNGQSTPACSDKQEACHRPRETRLLRQKKTKRKKINHSCIHSNLRNERRCE